MLSYVFPSSYKVLAKRYRDGIDITSLLMLSSILVFHGFFSLFSEYLNFYHVVTENILFYTAFATSLYLLIYLPYTKQTELLKQANTHIKDALVATQKVMTLSSRRVDLSVQLEEILSIVLGLPFVQKQGAIFLFDPQKETLVMMASYGLQDHLMTHCKEIPLGYCLCGRAAAQKSLYFTSHVDHRDHDVHFDGMNPHGHYCLPILDNHKLRGVLNLYTEEDHPFSESEHHFLESIGHAILGILQRHEAETALLAYNAHLEEKVIERNAQLQHSHQVQTAMNTLLTISVNDLPLQDKMETMLDALFHVSWLSLEHKGCIFLVNEEMPATLNLFVSQGFSEELAVCHQLAFGQCLCGRCALDRKVIFKNHIDTDHDMALNNEQDHGHYCLPLLDNRSHLLGVLNLYITLNHPYFEEEERFLSTVSHIFAMTIERHRNQDRMARQNANLQRNVDATVGAISFMGETRDPYTAGHQGRVAILAARIAESMGLPRERVDTIYLAGMLHDIGKIAIPAEILAKPGKLTSAEFQLIMAHSQTSYEILRGIPFETPIAEIVRQHHEKLDGSGYPQGLTDSQIFLEAKILAVADVFEALASHRPYRPSLGLEKAKEILIHGKGSSFLPEAVENCLEVVEQCGSFDAIFQYSITSHRTH